MAGKAELIARFNQARRVLIAMYIVAIRTPDFAVIHIALHEVVSLHPVLMRCHIGKLIKVRRAGLQLFQLPKIGKPLARYVTYRPVVILA